MAYVVKTTGTGRFEVRESSNGSFIRSFVDSSYVSAVIAGDEIHITKKDGRVEIRNAKTGSFIRTI